MTKTKKWLIAGGIVLMIGLGANSANEYQQQPNAALVTSSSGTTPFNATAPKTSSSQSGSNTLGTLSALGSFGGGTAAVITLVRDRRQRAQA
jgi:hypothetical protein